MKFKLSNLIWLLFFATVFQAFSQEKSVKLPPEATEFWEPEPRVVTPGEDNHLPPSDAIVLFDGKNLDAWKSLGKGSPAPWKVENGIFTVVPKSGGIETKESFGDVQVHLEWR